MTKECNYPACNCPFDMGADNKCLWGYTKMSGLPSFEPAVTIGEEQDLKVSRINKGQECPKCGSEKIKVVGCTPDRMNMNYAYDCQDCGCEWEGY